MNGNVMASCEYRANAAPAAPPALPFMPLPYRSPFLGPRRDNPELRNTTEQDYAEALK